MSIFRRTLKLYSFIYCGLTLFTPLYVFLAFFFLWRLKKITQEIIYLGITLLLGAVLFALWWKILEAIIIWINNTANEVRNHSNCTRLYKLLFVAFFVDFISWGLDITIFNITYDWSTSEIAADDRWQAIVWNWSEWILKIFHNAGFFITPRTTGLSTLLFAIVFYQLSRKKE